jgi:Effector Associated Constant Component 1
MADLHLTVDGRDSDVESLQDWLRNEPELRGHLRLGETPSPAGAMGVSTELIVGVVSSGAATALVSSLQVWLAQRRADVKLTVAGPQGRRVTLDARRVPDAERLLNTALGWADGASPTSPAAD